MLEPKPPSLSEYDIDESHDFKSNEIYETELLVLNALHWKMGSITPFAYLNQFTTNFCFQYQDYNSANLVYTATVLIFAITQGNIKFWALFGLIFVSWSLFSFVEKCQNLV